MYLIICKCNKSKSSEGFRNEDIYHFSILGKELSEFICRHVLSAAPNKHFSTTQRFIRTLLEKIEEEGGEKKKIITAILENLVTL